MKRIITTLVLVSLTGFGYILYKATRYEYYIVGYKTTIINPTNSTTIEGNAELTTKNGKFNYQEVNNFIAKKYIESAGLTNHGNIAFTFIYKL